MSSPIQIPAVASDLSAKERAAYLAPTLSALADENRLTIVLCLADGAKTNKQLQEATGLSQALVSHHVSALLKAELIEVAPQGRSNLISICRSEEHTTELQSRGHLVCRLLLETKKNT